MATYVSNKGNIINDSGAVIGKAANGTTGAFAEGISPTGGGNMTQVINARGQSINAATGQVLGMANPLDIPGPNAVQAEAGGYYSQPITSNSVAPATPINLPDPLVPKNYNGTVAGAIVGATPTVSTTDNLSSPSSSQQALQDYFATHLDHVAPTKTADIYSADYKASGVEQKQQEVNNYMGQIKAINVQSQIDQLATTGQGRGIPEPIIGGQQAQISKEATMKVLALSIPLAAAQGNLALAQQHLDTMFKIHVDDAVAQNNYQNSIIDAVNGYTDKKEQQKLEDLRITRNENFTRTTDAINFAQSLSAEASKNSDYKSAAAFAKLTPPDANSKTFTADLAKYNTQVSKVQASMKPDALRQAQIANVYSEIQKRNFDMNPTNSTVLSSNDIKTTPYGQSFIDVSSYKGKELDKAITEANKAKVPVIKDAKDANALDSIHTALNNLSELQTQFESLAPSNVFSRAGEKITRPFGAIFNTDTNSKIKAYQSNREALIQQINALAGSNPRISRETLNLAIKAMPQLGYYGTDTLKDGENKLTLTKRYLTNAQDSILGTKTSDNTIKYGNMSLNQYYNQASPTEKATVDAAIKQFPNYSAEEIKQVIIQ